MDVFQVETRGLDVGGESSIWIECCAFSHTQFGRHNVRLTFEPLDPTSRPIARLAVQLPRLLEAKLSDNAVRESSCKIPPKQFDHREFFLIIQKPIGSCAPRLSKSGSPFEQSRISLLDAARRASFSLVNARFKVDVHTPKERATSDNRPYLGCDCAKACNALPIFERGFLLIAIKMKQNQSINRAKIKSPKAKKFCILPDIRLDSFSPSLELPIAAFSSMVDESVSFLR